MLCDSPIRLSAHSQHALLQQQRTDVAARKSLTVQPARDLRKPCSGIHDGNEDACACSPRDLLNVSPSLNGAQSIYSCNASQSHSAHPSTDSLLPSSASLTSDSAAHYLVHNDHNSLEVIRSICDAPISDDEDSVNGSSACVCESYLVKDVESGQLFVFKPQSGEPWKKPKPRSSHRRLSSQDVPSSVLVEPISGEAPEDDDHFEAAMDREENGVESKAQTVRTPELSINFTMSHAHSNSNSNEHSPATSPSSSASSSATTSDSSLPIHDSASFITMSSSSSSTATSEPRIPLKHGVEYGECALKELAAYVMDHGQFAQVPQTALAFVNVPDRQGKSSRQEEAEGDDSSSEDASPQEAQQAGKHAAKQLASKRNSGQALFGSLQSFCENDGSAEDFGPSLFPADEVHKIGILDIRLLNLDRHLGNLLVRRGQDHCYTLIPIDHGYTLPSYTNLADVHFEWTSWWRQCRQKFSKPTLKYIQALNPLADALRLRQLGIRDESLVSLVFASLLLKRAAVHGCNLETIANMCQRQQHNLPSTLETIIQTVIHKLKNSQVRKRRPHRRSNSHAEGSSPPMQPKKESESQASVNVLSSPNYPLRKLRTSASTMDLQTMKEVKNARARKAHYSQGKSSPNSERARQLLSTSATSSAAAAAETQSLAAPSAFWSHCGELLSVMTVENGHNSSGAAKAKGAGNAVDESSPPCSPPGSPSASGASASASSSSASSTALSDSAKRLIDLLEVTLNLIDEHVHEAKRTQDEVEALEKSKQSSLQRSASEQRERAAPDSPKQRQLSAPNSPKLSGLNRMTHSMTEMDLALLAKAKSADESSAAKPAASVWSSVADRVLPLSPYSSPANSFASPASSSSLSNSAAFLPLPPPVHQMHSVKPPSSPLATAISLVRRMHSSGNPLQLLNSSAQSIAVQV